MSDTQRQKKIDIILFKVEACYPGEFDPAALDSWHDALKDYDVDEISAAFTHYVKNTIKPFLPVIGQIVQIIEKTRKPVQPIEDRAMQEWRKVILAIRQRGRDKGRPIFKDKITNHLLATQFSWERLCNMEVDNEHWEQKRWTEAFASVDEDHVDQLLIEATDRLKQLAAPIGGIDGDNQDKEISGKADTAST